MFRTMLAATDGSDHARKAVALAADLADKYGARLVILHVLMHGEPPEELKRMAEIEHLVDPPPPSPPPAAVPGPVPVPAGEGRSATSYRVLEAIGRRIVAAAEAEARAKGVREVTTRIDDGDVATRILACAEAEGAGMIVLGSRGLGDLQGLLMGSVSHKVGQLAPVTCITVK